MRNFYRPSPSTPGMFSAALSISGERFSSELERRVQRFEGKFEDTFQLQAKVEYHIAGKFDEQIFGGFKFGDGQETWV